MKRMSLICMLLSSTACCYLASTSHADEPAVKKVERKYAKSFADEDLSKKSFVNQNLDNCNFENAELSDANFEGASLKNCNFRDGVLSGKEMATCKDRDTNNDSEVTLAEFLSRK